MALPSSEPFIHGLPICRVEILAPHVFGNQRSILLVILTSLLASLQPPWVTFDAIFGCHVRPAWDAGHGIAAGDLLADLKIDFGHITIVC